MVARWYWWLRPGPAAVPGNHIEQYRNGVMIAGTDRRSDRHFGPTTANGQQEATCPTSATAIISNAYQVLYEEAHEHDPIKWITDLDTGKTIELPQPAVAA